MVVLLTSKNEEDPIKNEGARVLTRLYITFSNTQRQLTPQSVVESTSFLQVKTHTSFYSCPRYLQEDPIKNKGTRVLTKFLPFEVYGNFFRSSRAANSAVLRRIMLKFELVRDFIFGQIQSPISTFPIISLWILLSCHSNKSSWILKIKNITVKEGNVLSMYAKFQLHHPYAF